MVTQFAVSVIFPQYYCNEVEVFSAAGFHGFSVAYGVFVILLEPVGPDLVVALHFTDGNNLRAAAFADHVGPVVNIMHVVKLLRRPRQQKLLRQGIVAVIFHAWYRNVDISARLYKRKQLIVKVSLVAAEIVIGIGADYRVEKLLFKRQRLRIGLDGDELIARNAERVEKLPVFLGIAPEIGRVNGKAVFLGKEHACKPLTAAEVAYRRALGNFIVQQQLLLELYGIRPHDLLLQFGCVVFFAFNVLHFNFPFFRSSL